MQAGGIGDSSRRNSSVLACTEGGHGSGFGTAAAINRTAVKTGGAVLNAAADAEEKPCLSLLHQNFVLMCYARRFAAQ